MLNRTSSDGADSASRSTNSQSEEDDNALLTWDNSHLFRRNSSSSSSSTNVSALTIEGDIRAMQEQLQRVLTFCELQSENPLRLQHTISNLTEQLQLVIDEKNYWMKKALHFEQIHHEEAPEYAHKQYHHLRQRSKYELQAMVDTVASVSVEKQDFDEPLSFENLSKKQQDAPSKDQTHCCTTSSPTISLSSGRRTERSRRKSLRASFQLLQCSDQQCETFTPVNNNIRTMHRAKNNIYFMWEEEPKAVLIVKKPNEAEATETLLKIATWLINYKKLRVVLEPAVHVDTKIEGTETWLSKEQWVECQKSIDFVISLGGDGTILWVSSMFEKSVPPVISFAMGSLGFLAPFNATTASEHLEHVIKGGFCVSLRSRLCGTIIRKNSSAEPLPSRLALNEILIDRGHNAGILELVCYCDGLEITTVAADGIIIATPTGSTAYSLSAGGSMTHPSVPTMLFTPICPHTLSFRPLLFPDSATLQIVLPNTSRAPSAYVSFDGKNRVRLDRGDSIVVRVSSYPVPCICKKNENQDWFESVITNLNWNVRKPQKPLENSVVADEME